MLISCSFRMVALFEAVGALEELRQHGGEGPRLHDVRLAFQGAMPRVWKNFREISHRVSHAGGALADDRHGLGHRDRRPAPVALGCAPPAARSTPSLDASSVNLPMFSMSSRLDGTPASFSSLLLCMVRNRNFSPLCSLH